VKVEMWARHRRMCAFCWLGLLTAMLAEILLGLETASKIRLTSCKVVLGSTSLDRKQDYILFH
jgi:hypothetical protein